MRLHIINRATGAARIFATSMAFHVIEAVNAYDADGARLRMWVCLERACGAAAPLCRGGGTSFTLSP